jgi:tetratricopeptide (TPR) repeat protein
MIRICLIFITLALFIGCKGGRVEFRISQLEQEIGAGQATPEQAKALVQLYREALDAQPYGSLSCKYATRSGELLLHNLRLVPNATKMLLQALDLKADDPNKAKAAGLLAECYQSLRERTGYDQPDNEFSAQVRDVLRNNRHWCDSALQLQRDAMVDQEMKLVHPEVVPEFTAILEGYALSLDSSQEAKKAELLFEAGNANRAVGNFARAVAFYQLVATNKADLQKAANSQFMMAFVFENDMQALPQAKAAYEAFLQNFPKSEMAADARIALANLGKSPEQMLKELQK